MRLIRFGLVVLAFCLFSGVAAAGSFSFTGTFFQDDQLEVFLFTAPSASVTMETWGYAGTGLGTNAAGATIYPGGFDPVLTLFDCGIVCGLDASTYVDSNNDGLGVATDPATGNAYDSLLVLAGLDPTHMYALVLSENDNLSNGPTYGDGFSQSGLGNFTSSENGCGDGNPFCESLGVNRNGQWAVDILNVGGAIDATAPEPGSMLLLLSGIGAVALLRRQVKQFRCSR